LAAKTADAVNRQLERLMPALTPLGIVLGFFLSGIFIHLRPFVPWLFGLMTLAGALKLKVTEFGNTIRSPVPILAFFVSTHVLMPYCAMLAASRFLGGNTDTVTGFILLFAGPIGVSSFIWVSIFRGDKALCLTLILLDTLLAPLLVPGTVSLLMGAKVAMDMSGIAVSLVLMVVIPTIIGVTLNEISREKIPALVCPYLNPVSKICLMLVIAANTSPVAQTIQLDNPEVWKIAGMCIVLSAGGFIVSKFSAITIRCNPEKSVAMFFCGGLRNISAVTTIAVTFFPESAALPALLGIIFQQTISAVMGKLLTNEAKA
jgi:predicted Na+-dependent transporter